MIQYSTAAKNAMLQAVADALDAADPEPGRLRLYTADQPATAGAAITDQTLLADIPLDLPCGTAANGVLTITTPVEDGNLPASGTVAWGRLVDGNDNWIADLDAEKEAAGATAAIQLAVIVVYQGGIIRLTAFSLDLE